MSGDSSEVIGGSQRPKFVKYSHREVIVQSNVVGISDPVGSQVLGILTTDNLSISFRILMVVAGPMLIAGLR